MNQADGAANQTEQGARDRRDDASPLRLALFDFDGTLIDSLGAIAEAVEAGFRAIDRAAPPVEAVRSVVGLDVPVALARVAAAVGAPLSSAELSAADRAFREHSRTADASASSLYPGARASLERLAGTELLLGVATGKARRGLERALDAHAIGGFFITTQTASEAPGKPHPGMIERALSETGVDRAHTVMIGDTTFDMEMARNAGVLALGVAWGYHSAAALREAGASSVLTRFEALEAALDAQWGPDWRGGRGEATERDERV